MKHTNTKNTTARLALPTGTPVKVSNIVGSSYLIRPSRKKNDVVFFSASGERNLRCGPGRRIKNNGRRGPWAKWKIQGDPENGFSLQNIGHRNKGKQVFLGVQQGSLVAVDHPEMLKIEPAYPNLTEQSQEEDEYVEVPMEIESTYELSDASRKTFIETGLLRLPAMVDKSLVDNALSSINEKLGKLWESEDAIHRDPLSGKRAPEIRDLLYKSPLFGAVEQLLGEGKARRPRGGQLALRFPNNKRRDPRDDQWHIDGIPKPHMSPFQLLVGVALSSQPADDCGNLAVFPGFHSTVHEAVKRVVQARKNPNQNDCEEEDPWCGHRPVLEPGSATQLKLEPGDAVILHQKLPHRVSRNQSPNVRYMVYFRISHVNHKPNRPVGGLWAHFEGLQDMVAE